MRKDNASLSRLTIAASLPQGSDVAEGTAVWYTIERAEEQVKEGAMRFRVEASVGNADGVFDAAYDFGEGSGEEAAMTGTPEEIGKAVTRFLSSLSAEDCEAMRYGTSHFFVQLIMSPDEAVTSKPG
jgi:hypothetical protein